MSEYVRFASPGRPEGVLVSAADGAALERDMILHGNAYLLATDERHDGEIVYGRLDPTEVRPTWPTT